MAWLEIEVPPGVCAAVCAESAPAIAKAISTRKTAGLTNVLRFFIVVLIRNWRGQGFVSRRTDEAQVFALRISGRAISRALCRKRKACHPVRADRPTHNERRCSSKRVRAHACWTRRPASLQSWA